MRAHTILTLLVAVSAIAGSLSAMVPSKSLRWEYNFQSPQAATNPTVYYDVALVPTNTTLHVFNVVTGAVLWTFEYPNGDLGGYAAASADLVTVGTLNNLYGLSWNGTLIWTFAAPSGARPQPLNHFRPTFGAGGVYVTTGYTPLIKLSTGAGAVIWTASAAQGVAQLHATEVGSSVYVTTFIGHVGYGLSYDAASGFVKWNITVPGLLNVIVAPAVGLLFTAGGTATVGTITAYTLGGDATVEKYQLNYPGLPLVDYFVFNTSLYINTAATLAVFPTAVIQYDAATGVAQWTLPKVPFLFFLPCSKGLVNYEPTQIVAYDTTGVAKWRFPAVAANDGAASENNIIVSITATSVIALDF
jgi:hypothetical protein